MQFDIFGKEYEIGCVFLYANHRGIMQLYRLKRISEAGNLVVTRIHLCDDGLWRDTEVRLTIGYPNYGKIITTDEFPFTNQPYKGK